MSCLTFLYALKWSTTYGTPKGSRIIICSFKRCLLKSIKIQIKEHITEEANELDQAATASINLFSGSKLLLLVSCLNKCFYCSSRLYISVLLKVFYTFKGALTLSTKRKAGSIFTRFFLGQVVLFGLALSKKVLNSAGAKQSLDRPISSPCSAAFQIGTWSARSAGRLVHPMNHSEPEAREAWRRSWAMWHRFLERLFDKRRVGWKSVGMWVALDSIWGCICWSPTGCWEVNDQTFGRTGSPFGPHTGAFEDPFGGILYKRPCQHFQICQYPENPDGPSSLGDLTSSLHAVVTRTCHPSHCFVPRFWAMS